MKPGNKKIPLFIFFFSLFSFISQAEDKIVSTPLLNLDNIKPSFENIEEKNLNLGEKKDFKNKTEIQKNTNKPYAILIGLDKITAKSSRITINIDEIKKFGPLEIKILKCGTVKVNNKIDNVAYMQVKDMTKNENEKVFIFNGWTFSSDPNMTPFDHAIYDLQLLKCFNV